MSGSTKYTRRGFVGAMATALAFGAPRLPVEVEMPSLAGATEWLNSKPLTGNGLRGKVVAVDFCTYTCINWLRSLPYVRVWAQKYSAHGLVVLGVHTPDSEFEKNSDNIRQGLKGRSIDYPIAVDSNYAIWRVPERVLAGALSGGREGADSPSPISARADTTSRRQLLSEADVGKLILSWSGSMQAASRLPRTGRTCGLRRTISAMTALRTSARPAAPGWTSRDRMRFRHGSGPTSGHLPAIGR